MDSVVPGIILKMLSWLIWLGCFVLIVIGWKIHQIKRQRTFLFDRFLEWRTDWKRIPDPGPPMIQSFRKIQKMFSLYDSAYDKFPEYASANINGRVVWLTHDRLMLKNRTMLQSTNEQLRARHFMPVIYLYVQFSKHLPGRIKIGSQLAKPGPFDPDHELESAEFNRNVYLFAEPKQLGPAVLSPDFMEWYYHLSQKPRISIEGNACVVMIPGSTNLAILDQFVSHAMEIVERIERSGALEPLTKVNPLFPRISS